MRCFRCRRVIQPTVHLPHEVRVDGYLLHTGKTKRIETKDDCTGKPLVYQQLYDPVEVWLCVDCFSEKDIHDVWLHHFPSPEEIKNLESD